jgi:hypothetical protein
MIDRLDATSSAADSYSPQLRTALVLTGTGTAGAYHAGVLRALHESGVKLDLVAGRGIGVVGALFAAIDGAQRLWDEKGFWHAPVVKSLYGFRVIASLLCWAVAASAAIVALPLAAMALGLVVFPLDFLLKILGADGAGGLTGRYLRFAEAAFAPEALPTWLPRLVFLVLALAASVAVATTWFKKGRAERGAWWWRAVPSLLSVSAATDHCWRVMWDLVRGAAQLRQPPPAELCRRYAEMLAENLGQPGFRELLLTVHDVDAGRDLVFALVSEPRRRDLFRRATNEASEARKAEVFDLSGVARDYLADVVTGALTIPLVSDAHSLTFPADAYWRGETHRLCDRPGSLARLLDELIDLDVRQIVLVSAAAESAGPHTLAPPRVDLRGRIGEYLQSADAAIVHDVTCATAGGAPRMFAIRPAHNPIGPFDFDGGRDHRSDRPQSLRELMNRGYEDAYRQFIEPVVGASGDRVGQLN